MSETDDEPVRFRDDREGAAGYALEPKTRTVVRGLRELTLSETDFRLLQFFLASGGRVVTREELRHAVWGDDEAVDIRTIDARVSRLRRTLRRFGERDSLETLRGLGYRFRY